MSRIQRFFVVFAFLAESIGCIRLFAVDPSFEPDQFVTMKSNSAVRIQGIQIGNKPKSIQIEIVVGQYDGESQIVIRENDAISFAITYDKIGNRFVSYTTIDQNANLSRLVLDADGDGFPNKVIETGYSGTNMLSVQYFLEKWTKGATNKYIHYSPR